MSIFERQISAREYNRGYRVPRSVRHLFRKLSKEVCCALQHGVCSAGFLGRTSLSRARSKRDGTRAETRFGLSAKRTSPFKSVGVSVQSAAGSRCVRISGSNAG